MTGAAPAEPPAAREMPGPQVGDRVTFRKTMTVAEQAMFTGISGNLGGLYVDRGRARAAGMPDMVVFELAAAALASTCLSRLAGPRYRVAAFRLAFARALAVGATVEATASLDAIDGERLTAAIALSEGGLTVAEGEAVLVPAASTTPTAAEA